MRKVYGGLKIKDCCSGCFCKYITGQVPTSQNLCSEKDWNIVDSEFLDCSPVAVEIVPFFLIDVDSILYHLVCMYNVIKWVL